jgi:hypothetical protein
MISGVIAILRIRSASDTACSPGGFFVEGGWTAYLIIALPLLDPEELGVIT